MANRLKMAIIQAILQLHSLGWSRRRIADELGIDRDTVRRYLSRYLGGPNAAILPAGSKRKKAPRRRLLKRPKLTKSNRFNEDSIPTTPAAEFRPTKAFQLPDDTCAQCRGQLSNSECVARKLRKLKIKHIALGKRSANVA
jgi:hypothetical protein